MKSELKDIAFLLVWGAILLTAVLLAGMAMTGGGIEMQDNKYNPRHASGFPRPLQFIDNNGVQIYYREKSGAIRRVHDKPITGRAKRRINRMKYRLQKLH